MCVKKAQNPSGSNIEAVGLGIHGMKNVNFTAIIVSVLLSASTIAGEARPASAVKFWLFTPGMDGKKAYEAMTKLSDNQKDVKKKWILRRGISDSARSYDVEGKEYLEGGGKRFPIKSVGLVVRTPWPGEFLDPNDGTFLQVISLSSIEYPDPRTDKRLHQWADQAIAILTRKIGRAPDTIHEGEYTLPKIASLTRAEWKTKEYDVRVSESSSMNYKAKEREFQITVRITSKREIPRPKLKKNS